MTVKVVAKIRAFYNGEIIKPGQIITLKDGIEIPSWVKKINNKNTESQKNVQQEQVNASNTNQTNPTIAEQHETPQNNQENANEFAGKTQEELLSILDELINKSIEMGITLENAENKTIVEQIIELRKLIAEKEEGQ